MSHPFLKEAESLFDYVVSIRRDLHRHPELGFKETRTAGVVARELHSLGLEIATGVAETGVVALLEGARSGPAILLRFDMDALPIQEETGAEYASQNPGVMHACGHDGHTAIGLTVARLLHAHRKDLAGVVVADEAHKHRFASKVLDVVGNIRCTSKPYLFFHHFYDGNRSLGRDAAYRAPVIAVNHQVADNGDLLALECFEKLLEPTFSERDHG